jgi:hypothetical protein
LASSAAVTLWDFATWRTTSTRQVEIARESGALATLSVALNGQAMIATWSGDFEQAAALVAEDEVIKQATGAQISPPTAQCFSPRIAARSAKRPR